MCYTSTLCAGLLNPVNVVDVERNIKHAERGTTRSKRDFQDLIKMTAWFDIHNPLCFFAVFYLLFEIYMLGCQLSITRDA
jgi:hypothetical protein